MTGALAAGIVLYCVGFALSAVGYVGLTLIGSALVSGRCEEIRALRPLGVVSVCLVGVGLALLGVSW